jgi:FMN phosphatase YigB (HAD superfamily)
LFELLESFKNPKLVLTNANDHQMKIFGLDNSPYPVFSLKHEPNKTDPDYFNIFLGKHNFATEDVVYFEHDQEAVDSARSLGIDAFHYDVESASRYEDLKEFLTSNVSFL